MIVNGYEIVPIEGSPRTYVVRFPGGAMVSSHLSSVGAVTAANGLRALPSADVNSVQAAKEAQEIDVMALTALELAAKKSELAAECDDTHSDSHTP